MKKVYSIRDRLTNYLDPFLANNDRDARHMLMSAVKHPDSAIHASPDDYELFLIGEFNEATGKLIAYDDVISVALAKEFVEK